MDYDKDKEITWIERAALITNRSCFLYSLFTNRPQILNAYISCYNGINTGGEIKLNILTATHRGLFVRFKYPIYFNRGLYIAFGVSGNKVFIVYKLAVNER